MGEPLSVQAEVDHSEARRDTVTITVTDRDGKPVPDAEIIAHNEETQRTHDEEVDIERTDSRGKCQFRTGENATYRFTAKRPGFIRDETTVYCYPGKEFGIRIAVDAMYQGNPFFVFVHDQRGEPISEAQVSLETIHTISHDRVSSIDTGRTGTDGVVQLESNGSGHHVVQVNVDTAGEKTKDVIIRPEE